MLLGMSPELLLFFGGGRGGCFVWLVVGFGWVGLD